MKTSNIASSDALGGHHGGADFRGWVGLGGRGHDGSPWTTEEVPRFYNLFSIFSHKSKFLKRYEPGLSVSTSATTSSEFSALTAGTTTSRGSS